MTKQETTLQQIFNMVSGIQSDIQGLLQWKAGLNAQCKSHQSQTAELRKVLFDTPHLLKDKVQQLWNCKKEVKKRLNGWGKELFLRTASIVIATLIVGIILWFMGLYRTYDIKQTTNIPKNMSQICSTPNTNILNKE